MFVFRLALPVLCWRTALAVRVTSDEESKESESHKFISVRAAVFTQAGAAPNKNQPIRYAVQKGFLRGCIHEVAVEREAFMKKQDVTWRSGEGNISTALEALFEAQDLSTWFSGPGTSAEEDTVEQMGLSLWKAEAFCEEDAGEPLHGVVQECMQDFVQRGQTRARSWLMRGRGEKAITSPNDSLPSWLDVRFEVEHNLLLIGLSSESFFETAPEANEVKSRFDAQLLNNKIAIKATGFSVTHTQHHCKRVHKAETAQADEKYIERVSVELATAGDVRRVCTEGEQFCPESTSPRHARTFRWGRFAIAYTVAYPLTIPLFMGVGWTIGGAAGMAAGLAAAIPPGTMEISALPFAALAGIPFFGNCACNLNKCEWNPEQRVCTFTAAETSSNVFQWLPYPGTKCEPAVDFDESNLKCTMSVCSLEDFQPKLEGTPGDASLFGKLGLDAGWETRANNAVFNCLSDDGTRAGDLGMRETLVDSKTTEEVPNTPENRNKLYAMLNMTRPW